MAKARPSGPASHPRHGRTLLLAGLACLSAAGWTAPCAPVFVTASSATTVGKTLTFSHTPSGAATLLLVEVTTSGNAAIASVTFNGQALSPVAAVPKFGLNPRLEAWSLTSPAAVTANVVVTTGGNPSIAAAAVTYAGVDPAYPIGATHSVQVAGASPSVSVTSSGTNSLLAGAMAGDQSGQAVAAIGGQVQRWTQASTAGEFTGGDLAAPLPQAYSLDYNAAAGSQNFTGLAVELLGAACPGTPTGTPTASPTPSISPTWTPTSNVTATPTPNATATPTPNATAAAPAPPADQEAVFIYPNPLACPAGGRLVLNMRLPGRAQWEVLTPRGARLSMDAQDLPAGRNEMAFPCPGPPGLFLVRVREDYADGTTDTYAPYKIAILP